MAEIYLWATVALICGMSLTTYGLWLLHVQSRETVRREHMDGLIAIERMNSEHKPLKKQLRRMINKLKTVEFGT